MRIKKFIHLLIVLPFLIGMVLIGLLHVASYSEKLKRDEIEIAQMIVAESFNLSRLCQDIATYPKEERAPQQWRETFHRLYDLIQKVDPQHYGDYVEVMSYEKNTMEAIFTTLLEVINSEAENTPAYHFRLNHLENDMMLHSQALSNASLQLMSKAREDLAVQRHELDQIVSVCVVLFVLLLTWMVKRWGINILQRIEKLHQVTQVISAGNFKYTISETDDDELGDFAKAMNLMTQKLKQIEENFIGRTQELKKVNQQLSEMLLALDYCGIGIEIIDIKTARFEYVNACTCEMLGYSESEMLSMLVSDIDPQYHSNRLKNMAYSICEQGRGHFETEHHARDGRVIPVEVNVYYQEETEHKPARFVAFVADITARKAFEEDLLKTKVAAENANHAKSVFLANMSHELRTPLNAILGFAQLLMRNSTLPESVQPDVQTIIRCGQQLLSLINDVLEISSIETGHLKTRLDVINLPNLLSSLAESVQIANRNVWFHFEPAPNLPEFIETDFGKLRRMIQNLLNNAIKFTSHGSVTLQVYTPMPLS